MACAWGQGCFGAYLGDDRERWSPYDAVELINAGARLPGILVDQGTADEFLDEGQLLPETLEAACERAAIPLQLRRQSGYDHSYHFIATFIGEHMAYHAEALKA
jgi:S-formylglutathione hydrolase